jgi:hypothetical protein
MVQEDFDKSQQKMQRRLKDLEFGIKMKQEVISALTKEQQDAVSRAGMQRHYSSYISFISTIDKYKMVLVL